MLIPGATLVAQYDHAKKAWPFIADVERGHGVPALLLSAVGSRETNLANEVGDGGHGHGVWQLDDRSHTIPAGFDADVEHQAEVAAAMLADHLAYYKGQVFPAVCAYNAGRGNVDAGFRNHGSPDYWTTHSSGIGYGAEVLARWQYLATYLHRAALPKAAPFPSWFHRALAFPVPRHDAGAVVRIRVRGGVQLAQHGADVEHVQHLTGAQPDGVYGPDTAVAVGRWQKQRGLVSDGVFGPKSATAARTS